MANSKELNAQEEAQARLTAFRAELQALLDRHGAILDVTVKGDTHGVEDAFVDVAFRPWPDGHYTRITDAYPLFDPSA